jgi:hypothetical protein
MRWAALKEIAFYIMIAVLLMLWCSASSTQ